MSRGRKRTQAPAAGAAPSRAVRRVLVGLAWALGLGSAAYGLHRLEPIVHGMANNPTRIEWVDPPEWVQSEQWRFVLDGLLERIDSREAPVERFDIYSDRVCAFIGEQISASPWVAQVHRVTKQRDGIVQVNASFRRPFAMVAWRGRALLVDDAGVRLPYDVAAADLPRGDWLLVRGAAAAPPPVGVAWEGDDLAAGLRLANFLYRAHAEGKVPFWMEIDALDVGNFGGRRDRLRGHLSLVLIDGQSYVDWGLPVGEEYGVEPPADHKLMAATTCYRRFGGRFPPLRPIDVRSGEWAEVAQPPITESGRVP